VVVIANNLNCVLFYYGRVFEGKYYVECNICGNHNSIKEKLPKKVTDYVLENKKAEQSMCVIS